MNPNGFAILLYAFAMVAANPHIRRIRNDGKECSYCTFYDESGLGPYELLWTVGAEISPVLNDEEREILMMNPDDLRLAETYFEAFCKDFCVTSPYPK